MTLVAVDAQSGIVVRPATTSDLLRVGQIWAANQEGHSWSASPVVPSLYYHELATQELFVAEQGRMVLGFAALLTRGSVSFLADLFVDPAWQSGGVGRRLLGHVLPRDERLCCTLSSDDPRALSLYVRNGLAPYWPCFQLRGRPEAGWKPSSAAPEVVETVGDSDLVEWDRDIGGRARPRDHAYWIQKRAAVALWFVRHGRRVGYGYSQMHSDDLPDAPQTATVGPIGAKTKADAAACVAAAVHWASDRAPAVRLTVPGPHPSLRLLLSAGLRIHDADTFCSTRAARFTDPRRYLPASGDLF